MNASCASRLGIEHPLIQAPMAGSTSPALVAAVSNAGALGSLGAGYLEPQAILDQAARLRALGDRPYAIGLFVLPAEFEADMADRKSVVSGKSVSVRVSVGGRQILYKHKKLTTPKN